MKEQAFRIYGRGLLVILLAACDASPRVAEIAVLEPPAVTEVDSPRRILFVGNSFTYYNDGVDRHFERLLDAAHPDWSVRIDSLTTPNETLAGHYRNPVLKERLRADQWDIVVLQGASYEPVDPHTEEIFLNYAQRHAARVREYGADVAFFMTWAYRQRPSMINPLAAAYLHAGNQAEALVVPAGMAWNKIREERSTEFLYSDSKHPSLHGSYLVACVFYAAFYGESPVGIAYTAGLSYEDAAYLQRIAWDTTRHFFRKFQSI